MTEKKKIAFEPPKTDSKNLSTKTRKLEKVESSRGKLLNSQKLREKQLLLDLNRYKLKLQRSQARLKEKSTQFKIESEARNQKLKNLENVISCAGGPVFSVDKNYCYTSFNRQHAKTMKDLYGAVIKIGNNLLEYHSNPQDRKLAKKYLDRALKGETVLVESYAGDEAKSRHYYEMAHYPLKDQNKKVEGVTVYARDITGLKIREEENKQITRTVKTLSNSNQTMMRATNESEYMQEVCRNIENDCGYAMVWIGLAENDKHKSVRPVISAGFEDGYLENARISWADNDRGRGPTGTAIRTGRVSLCRNILTDPKLKPWRNEALKHGYASSIALPLIAGDKPFGALTIYSKVTDGFASDEVKILLELASDLAYGITAFKLRVEQSKAEEVRNWLASFPELNPTPVVEVDYLGNVHYLNPAAKHAFSDLSARGKEHPFLIGLDEIIADFQNGESGPIVRDVKIGETYYRQTLSCIVDSERIRLYSVDITARIIAEQGLRQARDELETRVQERTKEIVVANEKLLKEIGERKRVEIALRESEDRYRTLFETSPDAVMLVDMNNKIIFANQHAAEMHGYRNPTTLAGLDISTLIASTDNERVRQAILNTIEQGALREIEYLILKKDGSQFPAELNVSVVKSEDGRPTGYLLDIRDITERKYAQESLRSAYAYNRSLIEASLDPLVTITPEGKIGDVNKATEVVTGYSRDELIGSDFHGYFSNPDKAQAGYQKVLETGTVRDYNLEIRNKDGSLTPVLYNSSLYRDESGNVKGIFAAARDITERNRFETQLVQAEKHAVIGRMVGSITHEINNPLQTIKNCLYLIQQDVTPESPLQEPLEMATSETLRLTNLVGHLRELYRPKVGINKASNEILDILEEVHSLLIPHLNSAKVKWQPLTGLQRFYIDCVRDQILEVFLNISMNAIEAMQRNGGTLFVDMIKSEDRAAIIFRDTGPGIPEEIAKHIFEPFMTTKASGLGLGLSISYGIVQRHGGQIRVENQPGQGATFTVWLPQKSSMADDEVIKHGNK